MLAILRTGAELVEVPVLCEGHDVYHRRFRELGELGGSMVWDLGRRHVRRS